ncbi:ubiquinol-cytochrome c reductase iron-sulfur subunit [Streptomyces sp. NBC_00083]|uniref:QcrA and Rieske domain-containing protein n=1 Tax=Streptomyces sp. NBC_00083 TaxID=2975647 RepID=UPI00225815D5|nr:Rieske (2Fe-2S) protein [Streptomyces sp. NBC_00083]MCX5381913.1 Rieske (2Fe-2S) protein [Streptomyces sp. NBC_00083]
MSVTDQSPAAPDPAADPAADPAQAALHDRIAADSLTTRRDYLRIVATVSGGLAVGGLAVAGGVLHRHGDSDGPPDPKRVAPVLAPGESVAFRFPDEDDRAVAVRLKDGTLVGYSAVCTHLACGVLWRADRGAEGELYCPCHEGVFDARTGEVTAGPPPRPLPKVLLVEEADGSVWAVATARSGESTKDAMCREFAGKRPELAGRLGCPAADARAAADAAADARGAAGAGAGAGVAGAGAAERSERT